MSVKTGLSQGKYRIKPVACAIATAALIGASLTGARAESLTWVGGNGGTWDNTANWSPAQLPTSSDAAYLISGTAVHSVGMVSTVALLSISGTGSGPSGFVFEGGTLTSNVVNIADRPGSVGSVAMSGGVWNAPAPVSIGQVGSGTFALSGGSITSVFTTLGGASSGSGVLAVSGGSWSSGNTQMVVGASGTGTVQLTSGTITTGNIVAGDASSGQGSIAISGGTWDATSGTLSLGVGSQKVNTLTITGGNLKTHSSWLNYNQSTTSTATVTGGLWENTEELAVGYIGSASLNISGSGAVTAATTYIGNFSRSGTVSVSENGSLAVSGSLVVGRQGGGSTLSITEGGQVQSGEAVIGSNSGSNSATVSGFGSEWVNEGGLLVGNGNTDGNILTVEDRGLFSTDSLSFASLATGDFVRIDGGFLALAGDQIAYIGTLLAAEKIQLWDGTSWVTATAEDLSIIYYADDQEGNDEALADTGYDGLQNKTVVTTSAVPEPGACLLFGLGAATLLLRRRHAVR